MSLSIDDIDDILNPRSKAYREAALLGRQIAHIDNILDALQSGRLRFEASPTSLDPQQPSTTVQTAPPPEGSVNAPEDCTGASLGNQNATHEQETETAGQERVRAEAQCRQSDVRPGLLRERQNGSADAGDSTPCLGAITSITGTDPCVGLNVITLSDGSKVSALVAYHGQWPSGAHSYVATTPNGELGHRYCDAHSPLQALRDLREMLELELEADIRRRDREFQRIVSRTR